MLNSFLLKPMELLSTKNTQGQSTSEYSLVIGLAVVICIVSLNNIGTEVNGLFSNMIVQRGQTNSLISNSNANSSITSVSNTTFAGSMDGNQSNPANTTGKPITQIAFNPTRQNLSALGIQTFE